MFAFLIEAKNKTRKRSRAWKKKFLDANAICDTVGLNHDESEQRKITQTNAMNASGIHHIIDAIENHNNVWLSWRSSIMETRRGGGNEIHQSPEGSFPLIVNSFLVSQQYSGCL